MVSSPKADAFADYKELFVNEARSDANAEKRIIPRNRISAAAKADRPRSNKPLRLAG